MEFENEPRIEASNLMFHIDKQNSYIMSAWLKNGKDEEIYLACLSTQGPFSESYAMRFYREVVIDLVPPGEGRLYIHGICCAWKYEYTSNQLI